MQLLCIFDYCALGGIISPLLSNIVLNELDWWLSNQWETMITRRAYTRGNWSRALQASNFKEFFFVRYADDFKIFCRDYETAQKIFAATKAWLMERLGLEISPEKSKITNVRKRKTEFLGLSLFVTKKGKKFTTRSNISDKAKTTMKHKLKEQIIAIQRNPTTNEVNRLNAMILGMHNYYSMATLCNLDFTDIHYIVGRSLYNRLKSNLKKIKKRKGKHKKLLEQEPKRSKLYQKFYGDYNYKPKVMVILTKSIEIPQNT